VVFILKFKLGIHAGLRPHIIAEPAKDAVGLAVIEVHYAALRFRAGIVVRFAVEAFL
jgi:hypothetical protein